MGSDRVANAAAAFKLHTIDSEAAVVIDFGTATTLTAVNNKGNFLGGMITLGLTKTFQALHYSTAQLPELSVQELENLSLSSPLAFDTQTAIERGCVIGHIGMVRYWLERALKSLPRKTTVVATGGLARLIAPAIKLFDHVDVNLTLKGIKIIGEAAADQVGQV
jgi:type III pantothenate kinase